jgi:hypothetical protein
LRCGLRFCDQCAPKLEAQLFSRYAPPLVAYLGGQVGRAGYVLARINFTLRASGQAPTAEEIRAFNKSIRRFFQGLFPKGTVFGVVWIDEFGYEIRGRSRSRKAGGFNLHAHGIYFGLYLDWRRARDLWREITNGSTGFWISEIKGWRKDPERGIKRALQHHLKYVHKVPAATPERVATFEKAFNDVRRVHSMGVFYGIQKASIPDDELHQFQDGGRCPACGGRFYVATWPPIFVSELKAEGLVELDVARQELGRRRVFAGRAP